MNAPTPFPSASAPNLVHHATAAGLGVFAAILSSYLVKSTSMDQQTAVAVAGSISVLVSSIAKWCVEKANEIADRIGTGVKS